jgi:enoyl-CoA hydratase
MHSIPEIQFEEIPGTKGNIGLITLTRQQALNALNHSMFLALGKQLTEWDQSNTIKAVVIRAAEGRAFCAGGDIRYAYQLKKNNDPTLPNFFHDEYVMNKIIHHFSKPYIAFMDGITMGGGVGISIHGSHRVATERLVFSMPETGIGFYPDVGTTYFLSRYPHKIGFYLGLTGVRIGPDDCIALGITQEIIRHDDLEKVLQSLIATALPDKNSVTQILKSFSQPVGPSKLLENQTEIEKCFSKNSIEEILESLEQSASEWSLNTLAILKSKCPTSLKVTLRALQEAEKLNFDACMKMEYRITIHFIQGFNFFEGIRAVVIDKDQSPKWQPPTLVEVKPDQVKAYFSPLEKELA